MENQGLCNKQTVSSYQQLQAAGPDDTRDQGTV